MHPNIGIRLARFSSSLHVSWSEMFGIWMVLELWTWLTQPPSVTMSSIVFLLLSTRGDVAKVERSWYDPPSISGIGRLSPLSVFSRNESKSNCFNSCKLDSLDLLSCPQFLLSSIIPKGSNCSVGWKFFKLLMVLPHSIEFVGLLPNVQYWKIRQKVIDEHWYFIS